MTNHAKKMIWITVVLIIIILSYKIYAPKSIADFTAINLKNIQKIEDKLEHKDDNELSFAVVGNIKNSITIFDNNILRDIRNNKVDFIISTGNNIVDGGEGKYRVLHKTLQNMDKPFITGVGETEVEDEGYKNFYKYFGPFYYSFALKDSFFIFLDTTDHTSKEWQKEWLKSQLKQSKNYNKRFIIMNKPPVKLDASYILRDKKKYIIDEKEREFYQSIFAEYEVDYVFSSNLQLYHREEIKGVNYIISGGAGGELLVDDENSFYHYITLNLSENNLEYSVNKIDYSFTSLNLKFDKILYNIWISLQSFIYTNYITLIIVILIMFLIGLFFYLELNREVDYYRNFAYMQENFKKEKMKIAMFTNNYFPFIGGVPISIYRLSEGLKRIGHEVYIFAPDYKNKKQSKNNNNVIRCKSLFHYNKEGLDMPIVNIFSPEIKNKFEDLDIDIVHAHHPFWIGSKAMSLAENNNIPIVYTYHTRLEKYAHYLPGFFILEFLFKNRISHYIIRRFSNNCDAVFAPTVTAKEYLRNVGVSKYIDVMPTGVDFTNYQIDEKELQTLREKYKLNNKKVLFSVSRLSKEKNLYFLLKGIKYIKENTNIEFKLLLAGDGPEKTGIERYVDENNLDDYVILTGLIDHKNISKYYLLSDIFVFASTTETQGMVLLEAMAGNNPVVAVRSSGVDDVIENDYNGYKTKEGIKNWSKKVIQLMSDEELLNRLANNAGDFARENSIEEMAKKATHIYNKVKHLHR